MSPYSRGMERNDRSSAPSKAGAALRDAGDIRAPELSDEAAADEAAAAEARRRFRAEGMPPLAPDTPIAPLLAPGERLFGIHRGVRFDRRQPEPGLRVEPRLAGDLYVTSGRLVLIGRQTLSFELAAIEDAVVSPGRLLLVFRDGQGLTLGVERPRVLWVEIATSRARARTCPGPAGVEAGDQPATR